MNWYYVEDGKQAGPVDDSKLEEMRRAGGIGPDTLIWREGMANWLPYSQAKPEGAAVASAAAPGLRLTPRSVAPEEGTTREAVCTECGRIFPINDMIRHGNAHICASCKPRFMQKLAEGAVVESGLRYAGFWIRFAAKFVDGLIIGIVFLLPLFFVFFRSAMEGNPSVGSVGLQVFFQVGYYLAAALYSILFVGKYGATPGKMACNLKIVTGDGGGVGYGRATGRYFAEIISGLVCNIGYIIAAFDGQKRALHDHIASTRVVYKS